MAANVLDRIEAAERKAKAKCAQSFGALVRAIATGGKIDVAGAAETLDAAGKSRADVEAILQRLENTRGDARAIAESSASQAALRAEWGIDDTRTWGAAIDEATANLVKLRGAALRHGSLGQAASHSRVAIERFKQEHPELADLIEGATE